MVIRFLGAVPLRVVTLIQRDPAWNFITLKSVINFHFFSQLGSLTNHSELREKMDEKDNEYQQNRQELSKIDSELNKFNRDIQNIETELTKCKELYDR